MALKASSRLSQIELEYDEGDKLLLDMMTGHQDDIVGKAFCALWPKTDMALFEQILNDHAQVIHAKYGTCQESLLHRYGSNFVL